jgi:hypothetical protein
MSLYFAPVWANDALRALFSPYGGFNDPAQAEAAVFVRQIFDFGLDGLMRTSSVLAGIKLVIAVAFLAYLIEFARAVVIGREPDRATLNVVLLFAMAGIAIWAVPALAVGDDAMIRRCATQLLLVAGAVIVVMVERHATEAAPLASAATVRSPTPDAAPSPSVLEVVPAPL